MSLSSLSSVYRIFTVSNSRKYMFVRINTLGTWSIPYLRKSLFGRDSLKLNTEFTQILPIKTRGFSNHTQNKNYRKTLVKVGVGIGVSLVTLQCFNYLYSDAKVKFRPVLEVFRLPVNYAQSDLSQRPAYRLSRKIRSEYDQSDLHLTLYQYQTCPFCCKVRAYLDYHGFSYDVVEVNSLRKTQIKWSNYRKVPILIIERNQNPTVSLQLNDSSVIISSLETYLLDRRKKLSDIKEWYPFESIKDETGKAKLECLNKYFVMFGGEEGPEPPTQSYLKRERKWRKWVDDVFVHMISPNVYRTPSEAIQTFNVFSELGEWKENFSNFERISTIYIGSAVMYILGKVIKRRHGLKNNVRESLYDACNTWLKALGSDNFMGGDKPNLADISFYGCINCMHGCEAFQDMMQNTRIKHWYGRMKSKVAEHNDSKLLTVN